MGLKGLIECLRLGLMEKLTIAGESFTKLDTLPVLPAFELDRKPDVGRNDPCPCGSGLKFKRCCLNKYE